MTVLNKITGYERESERLVFEFDIPRDHFAEIKRIVRLPNEYEETFGSFQIESGVARELFSYLGLRPEVDSHLWYIEPFALDDVRLGGTHSPT